MPLLVSLAILKLVNNLRRCIARTEVPPIYFIINLQLTTVYILKLCKYFIDMILFISIAEAVRCPF